MLLILIQISFDINADFTSAFRDIDKVKINKSLGEVDIKSITSSIIESNLFIDIKDLEFKYLIEINFNGIYGIINLLII